MVGCAVGASILGVALSESGESRAKVKEKKAKVSLDELKRRAQGRSAAHAV
jgi:hypothetical protein